MKKVKKMKIKSKTGKGDNISPETKDRKTRADKLKDAAKAPAIDPVKPVKKEEK